MKYLETPNLSALSSKLNLVTEGDLKLNCRIELYSCKMSTTQKKLSRKLREDYLKESEDAFESLNDKGKMDDPETCKIYGYLISTLNLTFTDYDFSSLKPDQFKCIESIDIAMNDINRHLCEVSEVNMGSKDYTVELWNEINSTIKLKDCLVYTYISDLSEDPLSEGQIWSFNYFFYNKDLRKVLFFACTAKSAFQMSGQLGNFIGMSQDDLVDDCPIDL